MPRVFGVNYVGGWWPFLRRGLTRNKRRHWPVSPQAADNALALQQRDIAAVDGSNSKNPKP